MVSGPAFLHSTPPENRCDQSADYTAATRGIQKLQEWTGRASPGCFVVLCALDALVMQVLPELPAFFEKHVTKFLDVAHDARAFTRADVQPDARSKLDRGHLSKAVNDKLVPPYGRRERSYLANISASV